MCRRTFWAGSCLRVVLVNPSPATTGRHCASDLPLPLLVKEGKYHFGNSSGRLSSGCGGTLTPLALYLTTKKRRGLSPVLVKP